MASQPQHAAPAARQIPWMTEDLEMFQDTVRRFIERELAPNEARWAAQGYIDRDVWRRAGQAGLLCASIPEEYGGGGGNFAHEAVITREMARAIFTSLGNNVHSGIVAHYLLNYGTEAQKKKWLPQMASGEMVAAIAMSEPGAGSDLKSVRTRAVREKTANGDCYRINGAKTFITNGYHADLVCLVAKTDPEAGSRGVSLIMIETRDLEGFRRGRILEKIGQKGQDTAELFFDDVLVPCENLLGEQEGQGFYQLMQQLPQERMIIALGATASMHRAIELTTEYVRERKVFGQALADLQNTRFRLAECKTEATIAATFVDDCMMRLMAGTLDAATAAMAKWWCTQKNCEIIDECLQLHGGYGYMLEYPIARMYANARVGKIYGGSNEIMKELVARTL
ncbi:acyl-CoA dehydrogenase family protein [Cupriavidus oxalaticus]|jgi:acyl-CoA dehydrogenase|uniref:Acyl-[acyl-carrier-protein] dehydrogenase MbtN n=1 Tax=Cupriavidus oxalaticus TaxID=96344 RepID=A0A375GGP2_9BURK|nr:acyl-CoA dehydrogenase family protein [Cupriavidus oxalaticus]QRQ84039.1 acyl-CoA dehydrogenase family protein [Cupriavidus oxalaticus]QRQ91872.1 acyl-CoA dehydrogenase family protein [Cupriavidus oxalaticus]WQD86463.1 acyl-CoA dehydrogenase family protein [Cupriavidus oxalaticus]SPC17667.1 Acyl-CoA dehydrogenase [Cupriavidus oxalaticus]